MKFAGAVAEHSKRSFLPRIGVLAVGMGVGCETVFRFVDPLLFRSLPYDGAERLVLTRGAEAVATGVRGDGFRLPADAGNSLPTNTRRVLSRSRSTPSVCVQRRLGGESGWPLARLLGA